MAINKHIGLLLSIFLIMSPNAFSQHNLIAKWSHPSYDASINSLSLDEVTFYKDVTILWFTYTSNSSTKWISMAKTAKIIAYPSGQSYTIKRVTGGIEFAPDKYTFSKEGENTRFNLFFPAVPEGTTSISFIEGYESSSWTIYNIRNSSQSTAPRTITVNKSISTKYHTWTLKQIDITPSQTVCRWAVTPKSQSTYIHMTKGVYLQDDKGKKYYMQSCDGISMEPKQDKILNIRTVDFSVTFPAIDASAKTLTYYSSPTFQIGNIDITGKSFSSNTTTITTSSGSNTPSTASPSGQNAVNRNRSVTYTALAACFSYPEGNGEWSDFSDWQECNFTIEYDATAKLFTLNTAKIQKYRVVDINDSDPSLTDYTCKDTYNNLDCSIQVVTLPDERPYLYLRFDDEQICYALEEQSATSSPLTSISTSSSGNANRVLPEVINYPSYSKSYTNQGMSLVKVISNNRQTVLDFEYTYEDNQTGGIWLSPKTCIIAYPSGQKFKVTDTEGIRMNSGSAENHYKGEKTKFKVFFPALPANTTHFDFMEEGENSDWVLCGISNTTQYKKDFLMLNSTSGNQSINWEWYGGSRTFYVATTASDYDIIGVPSWCEITTKVAEGFEIECKAGGEKREDDYFIVKANGNEIRVQISRKRYFEYSSPQGSFTDVSITNLANTRKLMITPRYTVKNMPGKNCAVVCYLLNPDGDIVNDTSESVKPEFNLTVQQHHQV